MRSTRRRTHWGALPMACRRLTGVLEVAPLRCELPIRLDGQVRADAVVHDADDVRVGQRVREDGELADAAGVRLAAGPPDQWASSRGQAKDEVKPL